MKILAIDPGLSGGCFFLDTNLKEIYTLRFSGNNSKLHIKDFSFFLQMLKPEVTIIEQIFLAGREGGRSAITIGSNYGRITAALDLNGLTYTEVAPRTWQRTLGLESGSRNIVKQSAQDLAVKRFGDVPFIQGRERKPHDGLTDAACMALYAITLQSEILWDEKRSTKSTQTSASSTETSRKRSFTSKTKSNKSSLSGRTSSTKSKSPTSKQGSRSAKNSGRSKLAG